MPEGEVEMGTPQGAPRIRISTPDTEPFDYDGSDMDGMDGMDGMGGMETFPNTPGGRQATPSGGTGTEPFEPTTPMDYAISNEKHDYKYAYIDEELHMIKQIYLETLDKSQKIEIIFNMIKKDPGRYKNLIESVMSREFNTYEDYKLYVTAENFKNNVSTGNFNTLQDIVDYPNFIKNFFNNLPGAGETDVSLNGRIKSEIDEDMEIIYLNPDTRAARSLFASAKASKKSSKEKRSKKKKRKNKSKGNSKRKRKRSKIKSFKRYRRK